MGKHFYGTHGSKDEAMKIADRYAARYKKMRCYTPAKTVNACKFDAGSGLWTCKATAHHHRGTCEKRQSSYGFEVPVIIWNRSQPLDDDAFDDDRDDTDALPGDYED